MTVLNYVLHFITNIKPNTMNRYIFFFKWIQINYEKIMSIYLIILYSYYLNWKKSKILYINLKYIFVENNTNLKFENYLSFWVHTVGITHLSFLFVLIYTIMFRYNDTVEKKKNKSSDYVPMSWSWYTIKYQFAS